MREIYIKDMEMPKEGDFIVIRPDGKSYYVSSNPQNAYEREAIPVPPHGDLIDRSKLGIREAEKRAYEAYLREKQEFFIDEPLREYLRGRLDGLNHASGLVRFAPTIIPATEGET